MLQQMLNQIGAHMRGIKATRILCRVIFSMMIMGLANSPLLSQAQTQSAEAGKVLMSLGDVKVLRAGKSLPLARGESVQSGDSISTGVASNAQLRMTDGAVIAIKAQSEFKINEYKFSGKEDGSDKATLSLVKGGVRAVTGSIGKTNQDNLKVNAVVATVGIRGTGFNINYCNGDCVNKDKSPVKDGLYAGVFEGKIVVSNQAGTEALGVNQYLYVADKDTVPVRLSTPPNFLPDPLTGQKSAKPKSGGAQAAEIPSLNAPVANAPSKAADTQVTSVPSPTPSVAGVSINQPPALAANNSPITPSNVYNLVGTGNGVAPSPQTPNPYIYYLQLAETYPAGALGVDGLPPHNILPVSNPTLSGITLNKMELITAGTGLATYATQIGLQAPPYYVTGTIIPVTYAIGTAQQMEGGNLNGVVSWGRWANGEILQIAGYNPNSTNTGAGPISMPAGNGFHYIVGERTTQANLDNFINTNGSTINFSLVGATTPTPVLNPQGTWSVTSGSLTANFASASISGNMGLYTTQPTGYGFYNMAITSAPGSLSTANANNIVATNVSLVSGSLNTCSGGCAGAGNVTFYGNTPAAQAAGLSYNFNTGNNVVQGVAAFKR